MDSGSYGQHAEILATILRCVRRHPSGKLERLLADVAIARHRASRKDLHRAKYSPSVASQLNSGSMQMMISRWVARDVDYRA
mmetsp:Transcript_113020/g.178522  ORF Transcript_113020/g.178522 Transcript_113020/m.178522 type:complete len:82 (+) Transcript_113020:174-419(+)